MSTLAEKQLAFLEETVNHYNMNNRCSTDTGCRYSPVTLGLEGKSEGCAIGRHLDPELALRLDNIGGTVMSVYSELPSELTALGRDFLYQIQALHDSSAYWNNTGLNNHGKDRVETLKKEFEL